MLQKAQMDNDARLREAQIAAQKDIEVQRLRNEAQLAAVQLQGDIKLRQVAATLDAEAHTLVQQAHEQAMDRQHDLNVHLQQHAHDADMQGREHVMLFVKPQENTHASEE